MSGGAEAAGAAPGGSGAVDAGLARALRGEYEVRIGDWMSRGWTIFTQAGALFLAYALVQWLLIHFALPVWLLLSPMLIAGFYVAALKIRRGGAVEFSDFWLGFNDLVALFLAGLVSLALMVAGLCTLGLATVYFWVGYQFVYPLVVDRGLDFWEALEASRRAVQKRWLEMFVFAVCLLLLNLVAYLVTFSLGFIVSLPFTCCAAAEAYADVFGARGGVPGKPAGWGRPPAGGEGGMMASAQPLSGS